MDYDDNEFQSQNFQLVGGENNRFPSTSQSFALPKLDLDEHFEVHLRFDSLGEAESLLGIQGPDNNWIDGFSSGSNALDFTCSPAESCSISRHNNVWSEATSSESVEMLLKSVGEDEMKTEGASIRQVDAHEQLICLEGAKEPYSKTEDNINIDSALPAAKCLACPLGMTDNSIAAQYQLDGMSQTSIQDKSSKNLAISSLSEQFNCGESGIGQQSVEKNGTTTPCDGPKIGLELDEELYEPGQKEIHKDSVVLEKATEDNHACIGRTYGEPTDLDASGPLASPSGAYCNIIVRTDKFGNHIVSEETMEKHSDIEKGALLNDDSLKNEYEDCKVSDPFADGHGVDGDMKNASYLEATMIASLSTEGCIDPLTPGNHDGLLESIACPVEILIKDSKAGVETPKVIDGMPCLPVEGDGNLEKHSIKIKNEKLVNSSCGTEEFNDVCGTEEFNDVCNDIPECNPTRENRMFVDNSFAENTKPVDKHGEAGKLDTPEETQERQCLEHSRTENNESNIGSMSIGAFELHSSNDHAYKAEATEGKNSDCLTNQSEPTSQKLASADSERCAEAEPFEEEIRLDPPQTDIMDKPSSPALVNVVVTDILSSNNHRPFEMDVADGLVSEANPNGAAGSSTSPDGHFSMALDNVKLASSDIPNTSVVDDTLDKTILLNVSEHNKEAESPSAALFEEKDAGTSVSSFPACSNDAEAQVLTKPVSDPIIDGLPVKKVIHDVTVARIPSVVTNTASPEKVTDLESCSEDTPLGVTTAAPAVHASGQSSYPINKEGNDIDVVFEGDGHSQKCTQLESNTEHYSLEARPENSDCTEPNCHSPGGISCIGQTEDMVQLNESNEELLDQTHAVGGGQILISSDTVRNADAAEPHDDKEGTVSEDDRKLAFEVVVPSEKNIDVERKPLPCLQSSDLPQGSHFESEGEKKLGPNAKATDEEQIRLESTSCTEQTTTPSGKPIGDTSLVEHINKEKQFTVSPSNVGTSSKDIQLEEMRQCPKKENSSMRTSCSASVQAGGLPNLSSSISAAVLFHQPFTDLQQVQLRAQIFVYGSLIQGTPPDEACMVSAFGENDGGRNSWEGSWRVAVERFENQKSAHSSWETPLHSHSGARIPEQVSRCNSLQRKTLSPIVCVSGTKVASSAAFSSVSFPTPLWNVSASENLHTSMPRGAHHDFNQALTPLHSYPSSQIRQYPGSGAPWFPPSAYPGSLVVSSLSSRPDATPQYSAVPVTATQVTAIRESTVSCASSMHLGTATALLPSPGSLNVSVAPILPIEAHRKITTPASNKNSSTAQKSRKRKKAAASEDLGLVFPISQPQTELAPVMSGSRSTIFSGVLPLSGDSPKLGSCGPVTTTSQIVSPTHYQVTSSGNNEQRVIFSEETCSKIEQAKLQAEDAAAIAAAAVRHSQGIWSQLATQRNSGLASEVEEKLASAAVAAAAAASVAKAAAAAAKVAADAALQAKMLADEALDSAKMGNTTKSFETDIVTDKKLTRLTPVSILKGKDKFDGSNTVISVAREASRRRVEAASAAIKRAENLDAVVKAAELAAEAVSQAGTIVAMGDPLPFKLTELAEAGPENYWKLHLSTSERTARTNTLSLSQELGTDGCDQGIIDKGSNDCPPKQDEILKIVDEDGKSSHSELLVPSEKNYTGDPVAGHERGPSTSNLIDNNIQKGSLVEVVPDDDGLKGVWFSACVLDLKDGKAYVCYNDLLSDEGSGQLKEWIPLEVDDNRAPRIRIAHPLTAAVSGGAKKRRREAIGCYNWAVGDHVDALIRDGWWEGIVTEKNIEDETKLTVHFPAGGDTSIVRAWNLRPSLVWKEGEWTQWSRQRDNTLEPYEGDTPNEKRSKVSRFEGSIVAEAEVAEVGKNFIVEPPRQPVESRPLMLSAKERVFSVGKNVGEGTNSDLCRVRRTGLQKEGSRVVFGVPKPGKKRKFMDVSKHYVADKIEKTSEGNDSIKFAKYLMPQASRSLRNTSRVDRRGKAVDSKPKWSRPIKSQITQNRNATEKENSSMSNTSASASSGRESGHGPSSNLTASFNNQGNHLERTNTLEAGSFRTLGTKDVSSVELSMQPIPGLPPSRKLSSAVEEDLGVKQNLTPAVEKPLGSEDKTFEHTGKIVPEAIEPRRSNRRIQPTSRLLEGLQSSLIISKIPSLSHDRGSRALHRGVSSSKGKAHG